MNVQVQPVIESINYALENETTLQQKVVIQFSVIVTQNTKLNLLPITGKTILVEEVVGEATGQTLLQDIVTMERPTQKIRNIDATVTDISCQVITNKVIIQGTIHKQIFYIGTDNIEYEQGEDVNFSFFVDLTGAAPGMNCTLVPTIESVIPELLSETQLLQKVVLKVDILVTSTVRLGEIPSI
jgi:ribosome biogenesis SPOUT family RNA methylase Rps3